MKNLLIALLTLLANLVYGQSDSIVLASVKTIHSTKLNEDRILNIYLPDQFNKDSLYPVLYLLDGSANEDFIHIVGIVQFMVMSGEMEPTIVVGIANVNRRKDFTFPTTVEDDKKLIPVNGGSEKFIAFVKSELIPYVEANYKTTKKRTIIGQSLGGLVTSEILVKETNLFTDYVIVSPSLWWDKESLIRKFEDTKLDLTDIKVFLCVGAEEPAVMVKDAKTLNKILSKQVKKQDYKLEILKDEDHASTLHQAAFDGLRFLNTDPQPMRFPPH